MFNTFTLVVITNKNLKLRNDAENNTAVTSVSSN